MKRLLAAATALLLAGAAMQPAHADVVRAQTPHFTVYSDGDLDDLKELAEELERFDRVLRQITDPVDDGLAVRPLKVFILARDSAVERAVGGADGIIGFYSAERHGAFAVTSRQRRDSQYAIPARQILFHEYAHHYMMRYFPLAYPAWYIEGFAEFYSATEFEKGGNIAIGKIDMGRVPSLRVEGLYPLRKLLDASADRTMRPSDMSRFYATAWLLTHFLRYDEKRWGELAAYLSVVAGGTPSLEAAEHAFSGGVKGLEKDLERYLRKGKLAYSRITPSEVPPVAVQVASMPKSFNALYDEEIVFMEDVPDDRKEDFIKDVRRIAKRYPDDPYARTMLAIAEHQAGGNAAAEQALAPVLAGPDADLRAWMLKAELEMDAAQAAEGTAADAHWRAAVAAIGKANRMDLESPEPLMAYYDSFLRRDERPSDLAFQGLEKAHYLLPQYGALTLLMAGAMAERKDYDGALDVLAPVANDPHDSPLRQHAIEARDRYKAALAEAK